MSYAQSGALERCVEVEMSKAKGAKVTAGLWNATSERISPRLHIPLAAWSAGLKWQPSNLICQKDRLLAAAPTLRPAAQSNLYESHFSTEGKPTGSSCKGGISHFLRQWASYLTSFCHCRSSFLKHFSHIRPATLPNTSEATKENSRRQKIRLT